VEHLVFQYFPRRQRSSHSHSSSKGDTRASRPEPTLVFFPDDDAAFDVFVEAPDESESGWFSSRSKGILIEAPFSFATQTKRGSRHFVDGEERDRKSCLEANIQVE
jgi:hypothetical protein